jgi:hypothetical protein
MTAIFGNDLEPYNLRMRAESSHRFLEDYFKTGIY